MAYEIGQRAVVQNNYTEGVDHGLDIGTKVVIIDYDYDDDTYRVITTDYDTAWVHKDDLAPLPNNSQGDNKDMDIASKVRSMKLEEDERLLRKHNIVDETGRVTVTGDRVLLDYLFSQHRNEIVKQVKAVETTEAKTAKQQ